MVLNPASFHSDLSVVASVQSHPVLPEVFEEGRQDLCLDVVGFHTISATALLHHLKDKAEHRSETELHVHVTESN